MALLLSFAWLEDKMATAEGGTAVCVSAGVFVCVCMYVCMRVPVCMWVRAYVRTCVCACMCLHVPCRYLSIRGDILLEKRVTTHNSAYVPIPQTVVILAF